MAPGEIGELPPDPPVQWVLAGYDAARDAVKTLLTLSVAVVTVTATFAAHVTRSPTLATGFLIGAWVANLISIVGGGLAFARIVTPLSKVAPPTIETEATVSSARIRGPVVLQVVFFLAGLLLVIAAGATFLVDGNRSTAAAVPRSSTTTVVSDGATTTVTSSASTGLSPQPLPTRAPNLPTTP